MKENLKAALLIVFLTFALFTMLSLSVLYFVPFDALSLKNVGGEKDISGDFTLPEVVEYSYPSSPVSKPHPTARGGTYDGLEFAASDVRTYDVGESGVFMSLRNVGSESVYVYSIRIMDKDTNESISSWRTGRYLWSGTVSLGYISLPDGGNKGYVDVLPCAGIMVSNDSYPDSNWTDLGVVCSEEINVTLPVNISSYEKADADAADFIDENRVKTHVTPTEQEVRNVVGEIAKEYPGQYNLQQIYAAYEYVRDNVNYVNDPRGRDYWTYPKDTLESGVGDCEDQSLLLASIIESFGGTTKVYITSNHVFTAFYAGDNETAEKIKSAMKEEYYVPFIASMGDRYGNWILLDPTCGFYPGDLPCESIAQRDEVYMADDVLTEVYITY